MRNLRNAALLALAAALALAACSPSASSSSPPSMSTSGGGATGARTGCLDAWPAAGSTSTTGPIPVLVNSDLATGEARLILGLVDGAGFPLGDPGWKIDAALYDLGADGCAPFATSLAMPFAWSIEKVRGFFIGTTTIPAATRELGLLLTGKNAAGAAVRVSFAAAVAAAPMALRPGDAAPTIATPIAAADPHGAAGISTDPTPLARLYGSSAAELLAAKRPFMIVFASPAFCVSQACGPTLKVVKAAAAKHPSVVIIHVEPYVMAWDGQRPLPVMKSGHLQPNPIAEAWRLPVEPWIFTVGADGAILRSYEGVVSLDELNAALKELEAIGG
jgi:hypothetical protein